MAGCWGSIYYFTNRLETHPENSSANKIGIDLSIVLNDHFLRKTYGILNLQTCKKLHFVQLMQTEVAHWLWLSCLDPSAFFAWGSS